MPNSLRVYQLDYHADTFQVFRSIRDMCEHSVFLESGRQKYTEHMGRFDIITADPSLVISSNVEITGKALLNQLNAAIQKIHLNQHDLPDQHQHLPFLGGALGFLGYDFGKQLEILPELAQKDIALPDAWFGIFGWAFISDHKLKESWLIHDSELTQRSASDLMDFIEQSSSETTNKQAFQLTSPFESNLTQQEYQRRFEQLQDYIHSGDCYQVNFAQRFTAQCEGDSFEAFETISQKIPTPFSAYFDLDKWQVLSHSPERFLELEGKQVTTKPIKGTRARGHDQASDEALKHDLSTSIKDRAENLMIVDLLRNDLSRVSEAFSVKVPELFQIESYPNVHHLVSTVTSCLADNETATSLLANSFPGGSITGAPKIRAMGIIEELEPHCRSLYCGSVIYISRHGRMDSSITIRTLVREDNTIHAWGGGGIVADSQAEAEYQETLTKITPLLRALD